MRPTRSPYNGTERKLVLAFDIGTTFSGIAYSILDPGQVPEIRGVTRFPAQEKVGGDSKIPTIIYYDQAGNARAVGAEALQESIAELVEDEGWVKAEWFKLHMRPKSISKSDITRDIPQLPPGKSVVNLFADFMKYLYGCAKTYIQETHANGGSLWTSVESRIEYVLTHPNGWEGPQQQQMRQAAVLAGLVPNTPLGHGRIRFVTEGEASLHFCIQNGLTSEPMKDGSGILIVDAGGGTVDISAYGQSSETKFEEIAAAECYLQGSVFVTSRARAFLKDYLKGSKFIDDVDSMTTEFDRSAKLAFEKAANPLFIKFGGARDRDLKLNIRAGQLKLLGTDVAKFFEPSVSCIVQAIAEQRQKAKKPIASVFLVGGFSASQYLFDQLKGAPELAEIDVCRPDCHLNKAVADGAVSFYLDRCVNVRVSKFAYGVSCNVNYCHFLQSHRDRESAVYTGIDGRQMLPGAFDVILPKGTQISETHEFREAYSRHAPQRNFLQVVRTRIIAYRGSSVNPQWMDIDEEQYTTLCYVEADTSQLCNALTPGLHNGRTFFKMDYEIIMSFGLTELTAQIAWKENGVERRGPAKVVYDALD